MGNTSEIKKPKPRDRAYYRQRQKNHVFTALVAFITEEAKRRNFSKKDLAEALSRDPAQITRWLSAPSNFELDTLSDILLALDAEMDHRIVRFSERPAANFSHRHMVNDWQKAKEPNVATTDKPRSRAKLRVRQRGGPEGEALLKVSEQ